MLGRELAIILVIALLAAGGSQLPKLVRALGEGSAVPKDQATDDDHDSDADVPGPGHPSPGA